MTPDQAANIYQTSGPLALAFIAMVLMDFALLGVIVALVRWQSTNTVPISVYTALCLGFDKIAASLDDLSKDVARGPR